MAKARRLILEKLKIIDIVINVLDARAPKSTKNPSFDELFKNKTVLQVLNKSDLANEEMTKLWLKELKNKGHNAIAFSCINDKKEKLIKEIENCAKDIIRKYAEKGVNKTVRCLVAGVPNVGKSAILNRLLGRQGAKQGNKPGVTKGLQWIKLSDHLELLDSPGLLYPKIEEESTAIKLACLNNIKEEILDISELSLKLIGMLQKTSPEALRNRYKIQTNGLDSDEIFE
jgi:ribosome biogenesis GTPase A